jgi:hypothetical protein
MPGLPRGSRILRTVPRGPLIHTRPRRPAARERGRRHQTTVSGPQSSIHRRPAPLGPPADAVTPRAPRTSGPARRPDLARRPRPPPCEDLLPRSARRRRRKRGPQGRRRAAPAAPSRRSARLARALALAGHGENQAVPDRLRRPRNRRARRGIHRTVRRQRGRNGRPSRTPAPCPHGHREGCHQPGRRLRPRPASGASTRQTCLQAPDCRHRTPGALGLIAGSPPATF